MSKLVFDHSVENARESVPGITPEATKHAVEAIEQLKSKSEVMEYIHLNADNPNVLLVLAVLYNALNETTDTPPGNHPLK